MDDRALRIEHRSGPAGAVVYAEGRPLTGPDPALSMPRRLPDPRGVLPQTLFLIPSPLHGFGLSPWICDLPISCTVLLVELDPDLAQLQPQIATWPHHRRIVAVTSWGDAVRAADRLISRHASRRVRTVHLSGGSHLHRDAYHELEAQIAAIIQRYWSNRGTQIRLHRRWIANLLRNVALEGSSVEVLRGSGARRAILVGAGPSLDLHLSMLSRLFSSSGPGTADRAGGILVAIDTALPTLAAANIQPDFVVTMDSQLVNAQDFLPWQWDSIAVIADATTHFSIPRRFRTSRRYWFVSRFSEIQLFTDPQLSALFAGIPVIPPVGSVAPSAIHILSNIMGISEILLVGVDFWYRPPKSHAGMSSSDRWLKKATARIRHRDGHDRAPARPVRDIQLQDGTRTVGDAILYDHAQLTRDVVTRSAARIVQVPTAGLDIGAESIPPSEVAAWWNTASSSASGHTPDRSNTPTSTPASVQGHPPTTAVRVTALEALFHRLRVLEDRLQSDTTPPILDAGLDFVLVDLPQWPLMTLSPEWMSLHRLRILRSVRDYRRRVETLLFRRSAQD
ncbi:MAG: 6-hydroxymethylpterin diphosphokinase MptE-like protein [Alkalispirochaeta sp.]